MTKYLDKEKFIEWSEQQIDFWKGDKRMVGGDGLTVVLEIIEKGQFDAIIEGEPRYNVEELKKIWGSLEDGEKTSFREFKKYFPDDVWSWINNLILFIENNPEKVKEILERD